MSQKTNINAKVIGARFRSARSLVPHLNRKSFCEVHGLNRYTLQSWENGLHVSKGKNVEKFIEALAKEGVSCTAEWLIDGAGDPAKLFLSHDDNSFSSNAAAKAKHDYPQEDKLSNIIDRIIEAHLQFHEKLIACKIEDDAMAPKFLKGSTVLGRKNSGTYKDLHQKYCIVELSPQKRLLRKVIIAKENLILIALDERTPSFTLGHDAKLFEVLWHRLP